MTLRAINPLEIPTWDQQVARFSESSFFHSSAWCRVLHHTYGYTPQYLIDGDANGFTSALPLMEVNSWLTGRRGVSLPFTDVVPPLLGNGANFPDFFAAARGWGKSRGWKYLECRGGRALLADAPASTSFLSHTLDLARDEKVVFAGFEESVRRAVRKAEKSGIQIEFSQDTAAMRDFYRLLCKTRQRHGVPPQPWHFFSQIQRQVLAENHGWVVLARHNGTPVAGAVFFQFDRKAIYKFGASDAAFQQLRGNNLVMWNAIQRYIQLGSRSLDFGRTSVGNDGLRKFKLGWGTAEKTADYVRYDLRSGDFVTAADETSGWHTRVFNALPIWISRTIGAALYRHIG
ncbi:MAG: hypothetical protein JWM32_583 [Verrucomicrobia bacterium]|nr:hypothetical protein [Verrucomicrobiota bacterium]